MDFKKEEKESLVIKIIAQEGGKAVGRAYLYIIYNDLHKEPYGLLEDVFVEENYRGQGLGSKLLEQIVREAKIHNCYKLVADSRYERPEVHAWYEKYGFKKYGFEFRLDF